VKPVYQTILNGPHSDPSMRGNCYSAAIASVLELPLEQVPHFVAIDGDEWWWTLQRFVGQFGLTSQWIDVEEKPQWREYRPEGYWIASIRHHGKEWGHSLVMLGDELAHDPMPGSRRTTVSQAEMDRAVIEWLTATDPSFAVRGALSAGLALAGV
jgi:hypothetical protein